MQFICISNFFRQLAHVAFLYASSLCVLFPWAGIAWCHESLVRGRDPLRASEIHSWNIPHNFASATVFGMHTVTSRVARDLEYSAREIVAGTVRIIRDRVLPRAQTCPVLFHIDFKLAYDATAWHENLRIIIHAYDHVSTFRGFFILIHLFTLRIWICTRKIN